MPYTDRDWTVAPEKIANRTTTQNKLRECLTSEKLIPEEMSVLDYTLHSPRNFFTNATSQLGFSEQDQTILGRWSPNSRMPLRYTRSVPTKELNMRRTVIDRINEGWTPDHNQLPASCQQESDPKEEIDVRDLD